MVNRDYANRVLLALNFRDLCGYELSKYISTRGERISNGTLNPVLTQLVQKDLIGYRLDSRRKVYYLTESGQEYVEELRNLRTELRKRIFVDSIKENALFMDFLMNLEDITLLRELLEFIGDDIMAIVRTGFLLKKHGQTDDLDYLKQRLAILEKEVRTWPLQEVPS